MPMMTRTLLLLEHYITGAGTGITGLLVLKRRRKVAGSRR
jgi:hypothetical protein